MILYKQHLFKPEINYAFREINTWLLSEGFTKIFNTQLNEYTEYHWYKDGTRICLKFEHKNNHLEKYVYILSEIINVKFPYSLTSCKFKYDDYDEILKCFNQISTTAKMLRKND